MRSILSLFPSAPPDSYRDGPFVASATSAPFFPLLPFLLFLPLYPPLIQYPSCRHRLQKVKPGLIESDGIIQAFDAMPLPFELY